MSAEGKKNVFGDPIPVPVEWAVLQPDFRTTRVVRSGLRSREEAEAWRAALDITRKRERHEHFMQTNGIVMESDYYIGWRLIGSWHSSDEEDPNEELGRRG